MDTPDDSPEPLRIEAYLRGVHWPVGKVELADALVANGAPGGLVDRLMAVAVNSFDGRDDVLARLEHIANFGA